LLRSIGVTSFEIGLVLMLEIVTLAIIGTTAGIVLGYFLANGIGVLVTDTVNALYYDLGRSAGQITLLTLVKSILVGVGSTLLAASVPIFLASRSSISELMTRVKKGSGVFAIRRFLLPSAAICGVAGIILLVFPFDSLIPPFIGLFLMICGMALLVPWLVVKSCGLFSGKPIKAKGLTVKMAMLNAGAHINSTAVAMIALSVAVSATLGVGLMIGSFRYSVESWLDGYLRADIYLRSETIGTEVLDPGFVDQIHKLPGVRDVTQGRRLNIDTEGGPVTIFMLETGPLGFSGFQLQDSIEGEIWPKFHEQEHVLASEPFARRHNLEPGDQIFLPTDHGDISFTVAGIYLDYSSDRGLVAMDRNTFARYFRDEGATAASVYLDPDASVDDTIDSIRGLGSAPLSMFVSSNRGLKNASMAVFDQTFRVTDVLNWLVIVVAVIGIISAQMTLQLARGREYAMLKAVGFSRFQLGRLILLETGISGLFAGIVAVPMGIALSLALINVINVRSFGWTMEAIIELPLIIQILGLAIIAALIGGAYPAWRLARMDLPTGLRYD
jgi:putative ABC transport system permease protein